MTDADVALHRIVNGTVASECETPILDFKEDKPSMKDTERMMAEAAICFANTEGGIIVVGVRDKGKGIDALIGTKLTPDRVKQRIYELTIPHLNVEAAYHSKYTAVLLVFVPQSSEIHSDTQGRATQRINLDCLPMTPDQQARLREERRGVDWSAQASGRPINEISAETLSQIRIILSKFNDERRKLASLRPRDLCNSLGMLKPDGLLNKAGAMLLCDDADDEYPIIYQYRTTPGGEPKSVHRLKAPYVIAFARIMDLVAARRISTPLNLPNGQQVTIEDFPRLAVREALSNAICHRDYHLTNPIVIDHSPETFSFISPGPLVSGVTPTNIITTTSKPRNLAMAKACRILGFAEELGRGVDRMYREMIRSGKQTPSIEASFDQVRVVFVGGAPDTNIARFVASLPEEEQEDTDTMIVTLRLCNVRTLSASSVSPFLQKSIDESESVLKRLASEPIELLERTRATVARSAGIYRLRGDKLKKLGAAVIYQRRSADEIDRKVIAHVREYGKITNRTLQNVFDIHVFKARDLISDLVQRDILCRISKSARGNKVEWGPGPSFPVSRAKQPSHRNKGFHQEEFSLLENAEHEKD